MFIIEIPKDAHPDPVTMHKVRHDLRAALASDQVRIVILPPGWVLKEIADAPADIPLILEE